MIANDIGHYVTEHFIRIRRSAQVPEITVNDGTKPEVDEKSSESMSMSNSTSMSSESSMDSSMDKGAKETEMIRRRRSPQRNQDKDDSYSDSDSDSQGIESDESDETTEKPETETATTGNGQTEFEVFDAPSGGQRFSDPVKTVRKQESSGFE